MNAKRLGALAAAVLGLGLLSAPSSAAPPAKGTPHFYSIDVGSEIAGATDTFVASLAPTGGDPPYVIVGSYLDTAGDRQGFIAHLTSSYQLADATTMSAPAASSWTYPTSVNQDGTSVGFYLELGTGVSYGFVRTATGDLTTGLHPSDADTSGTTDVLFMSAPTYGDPLALGTFPEHITDEGLVTGFYTAPDTTGAVPFAVHGFTWQDGTFTAPIDQPGTLQTMLLGVTPAGMQYGGATVPDVKRDTATGKGLTISTNHKGESVYTNYVDTATTERLPSGFCGWTQLTGATDTGLMVGNAGNGCAIYHYAWTLRGGKYTNFVYVDPVTATPAQQTLITGITPTGIITGGYVTGWSETGTNWLSPSSYFTYYDEQLDQAYLQRTDFGHWHGFIQTPN